MQADAGEWDGQSRVTAEAWPSEHSGHFLDTTGACSLSARQLRGPGRCCILHPQAALRGGHSGFLVEQSLIQEKFAQEKRQAEVNSQDFYHWVFKSCF